MSINAEYEFYSDLPVGFYYEPVTNVRSNSATVSSDTNFTDLGRYEGAYEDTTKTISSLSEAIQSSRDVLYGESIPDFGMIMNSTEANSVVHTEFNIEEVSQNQYASHIETIPSEPAKRKYIINMGVSAKRAKNQNDAVEPCAVCSMPSIKGKPGKPCIKCDLWIHNKCLKQHLPSCV